MPQLEGAALEAVRVRREELRARYLREGRERRETTALGVHHVAFICRDVEETIRFHQEFLGFPLVEIVENRDYRGSTHFFFDIGHGNLLGFFDFPGHDHPPFAETVGGIQHLAISVGDAQFDTARQALDAAGIPYAGPDRGVDDSLYLHDPNSVPIELYRERLGVFNGHPILGEGLEASPGARA
ncbi:VOC family protein [Streptomyces sp. NPDC048639]|uniref:VOC family protein n=1 Tax=Streptomyces sp. NPDC048639 TaxID=3365581 RepID=UPI003717C720